MDKSVRKYRWWVQGGMFALIVWLGYRFIGFTRYYETGGRSAFVPHPAGAAGFLPIGGLTSLKYWLVTGSIHPAHPAALVLLIAALSVSVVLKKGFCGWICPINFISERIYPLWAKVFRRNARPPKWVDYPLRSLKYILLFFFFTSIVIFMNATGLHNFLDGDYWKVADVKMLKFFTEMSGTSVVVIGALVFLSLPIRNFWCRYLCPYGALLGIVAVVSPFEITRDKVKCIDCGKCTKNCPAYLPVDQKRKVVSPECTSCMTCLSGCPTAAITYSTPGGGYSLRGKAFPLLLLGIFFGIIAVAMLTGHWNSSVADADLYRLVPIAESLMHP